MKRLYRWAGISGEDDFGCRVGTVFGSLVLAMKDLCRWAGVSGEDGFVTPKNEGVQRAL
jgi:hypothetical protein